MKQADARRERAAHWILDLVLIECFGRIGEHPRRHHPADLSNEQLLAGGKPQMQQYIVAMLLGSILQRCGCYSAVRWMLYGVGHREFPD